MSARHPYSFPVTLGNPCQFAAKVDLNADCGGEWLFGRMCLVIGGSEVGDYDQGTSLRDVLLQMHWKWSDSGKRRTDRFDGNDAVTLFDTIRNLLYGESDLRDVAEIECWAKHVITPPVDVFDGVTVLQFDESSISRIIWRSRVGANSSVTHEIRVPLGCVEEVYAELFIVLDNLLQWQELGGDD